MKGQVSVLVSQVVRLLDPAYLRPVHGMEQDVGCVIADNPN